MLRLDDHAVNVFTDGSCLPGPRRGGYAFLFVTVDEDGREVVEEFSGPGISGANNQEMELTACVEALKRLSSGRSRLDLARFRKVVIHTDSMFVCENFDTAKFQWSANRWMRKEGPPVLHAHLWKALVAEAKRIGMPVVVKWVPGKSSPHTKCVDKLAKEAAKGAFGRAPGGRTVRRKHTAKSVEPGSVGVEGQEIEIQIVTAEHQRVQRCWRYKYEVMSADSPYFGNVDFVFSDRVLRTSYVYRVRLNEDPKYPQIVEVLKVVGPAQRSAAKVEVERE